jgi:hypothetical protein
MNKLARWIPLLVVSLAAVACGSKVEDHGTSGGGQGGGGGTECSPTAACPQGSFCDYADNRCGQGDLTGSCRPAPVSHCSAPQLACGCDGVVAASCDGAIGFGNAVDIAPPETCAAPAGTFACGDFFCGPIESQYCQGVLNLDTCAMDYTCVPIPADCNGSPSCACITTVDDLMSCDGDTTTGITGLLPGGDSPTCP